MGEGIGESVTGLFYLSQNNFILVTFASDNIRHNELDRIQSIKTQSHFEFCLFRFSRYVRRFFSTINRKQRLDGIL